MVGEGRAEASGISGSETNVTFVSVLARSTSAGRCPGVPRSEWRPPSAMVAGGAPDRGTGLGLGLRKRGAAGGVGAAQGVGTHMGTGPAGCWPGLAGASRGPRRASGSVCPWDWSGRREERALRICRVPPAECNDRRMVLGCLRLARPRRNRWDSLGPCLACKNQWRRRTLRSVAVRRGSDWRCRWGPSRTGGGILPVALDRGGGGVNQGRIQDPPSGSG